MTQWLQGLTIIDFLTSTNGQVIVVSSVIILMLLLAWLFKRLQRVQTDLAQLQHEIRAITSGNLGMGRKISQFAEEIAKVETGIDADNVSSITPQTSEKTYQQASLLLSRGASIEEVVDCCEIAPAEAELLATMRHSAMSQAAC